VSDDEVKYVYGDCEVTLTDRIAKRIAPPPSNRRRQVEVIDVVLVEIKSIGLPCWKKWVSMDELYIIQ